MEYNYHKNAGQLAFIKFVKGLVHLLIRPKVEWKDKSLKKSLKGKPVVFVCNHTHHFDGVVISSVLSRYKPYMLVKKSWYDKSGTGSFIRICRSIPVDFDTMDTNWYAQSGYEQHGRDDDTGPFSSRCQSRSESCRYAVFSQNLFLGISA